MFRFVASLLRITLNVLFLSLEKIIYREVEAYDAVKITPLLRRRFQNIHLKGLVFELVPKGFPKVFQVTLVVHPKSTKEA